MSNEVKLVFAGDSQQLEKTFAKVGSSAQDMAADVDKASRKLSKSAEEAGGGIADAVDGSEAKFRGLGDVIGGTGDIMEGFKTGNVASMAMGFADLAGGLSSLVIPAFTALKGVIVTQLGPAFTFLAANPLIAGILAGGAIIAGLIILEKKFGLVSSAVKGLGDIFSSIWPGIKAVLNGIITGLEIIGNGAIAALLGPITLANHIPGIKSIVPDVPKIHLPRFHTGGVAGRDTLAVLQQGETVLPRGQGGGGGVTIVVQGSIITERDFGRYVQDALRNNKLIGVTA